MTDLSGRVRKQRATAAFAFLVAGAAALFGDPESEASLLLRRIHEEVRTMPVRPGEAFVRQEFFIGKGEDDTYKDIAVSIVLPEGETAPVMIIQFTWMKRDRRDKRTATAGSTKILRCIMNADSVEWNGDSFDEAELAVLARGLLEAVRNKKRLLKKTPSPNLTMSRGLIDLFP